MKLLQELLALPEQLFEDAMNDIKASDKTLELKDVIESFPSKYKKVLETFWGTSRLTYKGQPLFKENHEFGPAYEGAIKAGEKALKKAEVTVEVEGPGKEYEEFNVKIDDGAQEVYLGYDPKADCLYIGFDTWGDGEEEFNEWANTFDDSDKDVEKAISKAWKEFSDKMFHGALYELKSSNGKSFTAEETSIKQYGFYRGIYDSREFKSMKLVDLRLD